MQKFDLLSMRGVEHRFRGIARGYRPQNSFWSIPNRRSAAVIEPMPISDFLPCPPLIGYMTPFFEPGDSGSNNIISEPLPLLGIETTPNGLSLFVNALGFRGPADTSARLQIHAEAELRVGFYVLFFYEL